MLQTIEAVYEPRKGVIFKEATNVSVPTKVLVTFIEPYEEKGSPQVLLNVLKKHTLPQSANFTNEEIEQQIQDIAQSWE